MHIHILGICGTFMGGIASLAVAKGYQVSGQDENVYPPMSKQLEDLGITLQEGYHKAHIPLDADMIIIGNALKRGNPAVEYVLDQGLPYQSGPQWLSENLLKDRWVIGVAGTHGKTTTTSMIAWILSEAGFEPGFLVGGVPANFGVSARWGKDPYFVVEADEYDCAFFDKRSKFIHYRPRTCLINNVEFDHADIFQNLDEIKKQFHHLVRTVPGKGAVIYGAMDENVKEILVMGCWSSQVTFGLNGEWQAKKEKSDGSEFEVSYRGKIVGKVKWQLIGEHNIQNALAAIASAVHAGIMPEIATKALSSFKSVKRRMEVRGQVNSITVYDDFAHHPTAIRLTIAGLKAKIGQQRLIAVLDLRSNTMCLGSHQHEFVPALKEAQEIFLFKSSKVNWDVENVLKDLGKKLHIFTESQTLLDELIQAIDENDHVLIMSNGSFDNIHQRLLQALSTVNLAI